MCIRDRKWCICTTRIRKPWAWYLVVISLRQTAIVRWQSISWNTQHHSSLLIYCICNLMNSLSKSDKARKDGNCDALQLEATPFHASRCKAHKHQPTNSTSLQSPQTYNASMYQISPKSNYLWLISNNLWLSYSDLSTYHLSTIRSLGFRDKWISTIQQQPLWTHCAFTYQISAKSDNLQISYW